jgi:hypothetical protein
MVIDSQPFAFGGEHPIEKTGFLPEFIPAKAGAGMTNWKTVFIP